MKNLTYAFLFICVSVLGQTGSLKGKITFEGKGLDLVDIQVKKSRLGTATKKGGNYEINNIPTGKQILYISFVGFKTRKKEVLIKEGETTELNLSLQKDILGLDQVVVSATRSHLDRKLSPVIVTVTDKLKLDAVQAVTLSEGLSFQPGLRFETDCQNCGYSQVRINGLEGSYSQILVDSRPIFSALAGVYGLDQIPVNSIERVEVIRGGGSALYGSNAIAGTINIITKDPTNNSFQIGSTTGIINGEKTDVSLTANGTVVSEDYDTGMSFFSMYRKRNAYDHNGDGFTEMTDVKSKSFGAKGFMKPNDRSRLTAEFTVLKEFRRGGNKLDLLPYQSDITEQIDSDVLMGSLTYELANEAKTNRYSFYASGSLSENNNYYGGNGDIAGFEEALANNEVTAIDFPDFLSFGTSKDDIIVLGSQFIHNFDNDIFTAGIEYKHNKTADIKKAIGINLDQTVKMYGLYSQYEWIATEKLSILTGLRADFHNLLEDEAVVLNPRLNIMYKATEDFRLRTSYAKGFRAPQFFTDDLHVQIAAGDLKYVVLSDNLKSETSHSFTASIDWSKNYENGSQIGLTLEPFYTILDNPFYLEELGDGIQEKRNGDQATVMGTNLEFKFSPSQEFNFQAGLTFQQGKFNEDVELGQDKDGNAIESDKFLRSPSVYGNFVATYAPTKEFRNTLSSVYTGSMDILHETPDGLTLNEGTDSFFELNWKSSYSFNLDDHKHLQLQLSGGIQNILNSYQNDFDKGADRDAAYVYGPSRPRTFFIGLKIGNNL